MKKTINNTNSKLNKSNNKSNSNNKKCKNEKPKSKTKGVKKETVIKKTTVKSKNIVKNEKITSNEKVISIDSDTESCDSPNKDNFIENTKEKTKEKTKGKNESSMDNKNKNKNKNKNESVSNIEDPLNYDYKNDVWKLIDAFFEQNNNKQLVKHQLESFSQFINPQIMQIIRQFNPVTIYHDYVPEHNKHRVELNLYFEDYQLGKPLIHENDGSYQTMTPSQARLRHLTYASPLSIDIRMKRILRTGDKLEKEDTQEVLMNKINFGKIPIMVQSKYCVLNERTGIDLIEEGECPYDKGSCFIIGGNEKVIVSQERIAENKVFVFNNQRQTKSIDAEIKSVNDNQFSVAMTNSVKYIFKSCEIIVDAPNFKSSINIFILLRALGIETDKQLVSMIIWDLENKDAAELKELVKPTMVKYKKICSTNNLTSIEKIRDYLIKYTMFKGTNKEIKMDYQGKLSYLLRSLEVELLPHLRKDYQKKAHLLGFMARKLIKVYLGHINYDDRDSYQNKRVDTPGILMASLFRQCFNRLVKDMKKSISKELKSNKSGKDVFDIINTNNIYKIIKPTLIEGGLKYACATGNWSVKTTNNPNQKAKVGTAQVLNRLGNQSCLSHLRRVNSPSEKNNGKIIQPRKIHSTQWGYLCPAETPEGAPVGLVKNMSLCAQITINSNSTPIREWIKSHNLIPIGEFSMDKCLDFAKIFVNGDWLGLIEFPSEFIENFKECRRNSILNIYSSIYWNTFENEIYIYTDAGRITRPLFIVEKNKLKMNGNILDMVKNNKNKWNTLLFPQYESAELHHKNTKDISSVVEFIDCEEVSNCLISVNESTLTEDYKPYIRDFTHCEIHSGLILGVVGCIVPFPDHNQSPRNTYQSAMAKQAMSISTTNFQKRMDTLGYVMYNIERPIVRTNFGKYINFDKMPNGLNAIIAVASYTGYNQEDSLIINQHALDRGLFRATFYRTYKDDEKKIQAEGKEEKFTRPDPRYTRSMKPGNYSKLDDNGFIQKDSYVDSRDIIIGKVLPVKKKNLSNQSFRDCSTSLRMNESGFVDMVYTNRNSDGHKFVKVRIRSERTPVIGDKFSSRCGQKGTCGMVYPQEKMPFNKDGISPDAIMNPHAIPSRMTIGQLLECVLGKSGAILGGYADCSPFTDVNPNKIGEVLESLGFEGCGNEILYNGITGEQMNCAIFMGPTFYQRLKHMVNDKMHSRSSGPVVQLTRQPAEGRSRDGGLRIGEMERDCLIGSTPISLANGLSLKIEDMQDNDNQVLGWNSSENGMVKSKQTNFLYKGERECLDLSFNDGRTVTYTPNHKLLTSENQWVKVKDLRIGIDKIKTAVKYPLIDINDEMKQCQDWVLQVGDLILNCDSKDNYLKSLAFARIIGYLITDGHITEDNRGMVYLGHMIDVENFLADLSLFQDIVQDNFKHKNLYLIRLRASFIKNIVQLPGILIGKKSNQSAMLPNFILQNNCPIPIIREFLGGLFGGDGHTCHLALHRGKRDILTSVSFSQTKSWEHQESLMEMIENIQLLMNKCGIEKMTIQNKKETSYSKNKNSIENSIENNIDKDDYTSRSYQVLLHLDINELLPFSEKIGFRYCCHKSQRLEAGVAYRRLRNTVIRQREWLTNKVDELTHYSEIKKQIPEKQITTKKYILQAINDLLVSEPLIHSYAIPNRHSLIEHLIKGNKFSKFNSRDFPSAEQFLKDIGALQWFLNDENRCYGVSRCSNALPTMELTLIDRRNAGIHKVYDIEVENEHSFAANGIVSHNCMISHGSLAFLKERLMDVSDKFEIFCCRECGLFSTVNTEIELYKCQGCEKSSNFARLYIPYACKLLFQELQGMGIAPRMKFNK